MNWLDSSISVPEDNGLSITVQQNKGRFRGDDRQLEQVHTDGGHIKGTTAVEE